MRLKDKVSTFNRSGDKTFGQGFLKECKKIYSYK